MKHQPTLVALAAALTLVIAACGDDSGGGDATTVAPVTSTATVTTAAPATTATTAGPATSAAPTTTAVPDTTVAAVTTAPAAGVGPGEGEVNIVAWAGYVENGSSDPAVDWVTGFEAETGCKVNVKNGNTSDEMVQLMQTGEYDVVSASGDATTRLIQADEVVPVDVSRIPNYVDVFEGLKLKPWNSVDGVPYGVPHGRGANLIVYNTEAYAGAPPDSWSEVFEQSTASPGAVSIYDNAIYIADAALYLMAVNPELGITNPYSLDQAQFDAAITLLEQQKPLVGQYWGSYTDQQAALEAGTALVGTTWQITVNFAVANGAKVDTVKAKEGATGWSDTWMISSKAKHPNCAYLWLNHIISPAANAAVAEWFGEAPSNAKSCGLTAVADHCAQFHAEDDGYWDDVWYWTTATEACLDGRTDVKCVPYVEWVNAWTKLRA